MKTFLNTLLMLEDSEVAISIVVSTVLYGAMATLNALISLMPLNWARGKIRMKPRPDPIQLEHQEYMTGNV